MSASDSPQPPATAADAPPASVDPQSIEGLFLAALQRSSPEERAAYLDEVCAEDVDRRRRVVALLRAYDDAGSFLETPAGGRAGYRGLTPPARPDEISLDFLGPTDKPGCLGTLGPYEIIDVIGRGGMGIVLRALDPKLNRIVAVKVLAPELAANPSARKRFLREAQAAAAISHPHVVTIHAVEEGVSDPVAPSDRVARSQLPYLVMECVVGQSLQDKLDRTGALNVTEILRISHQIACGLAAAHAQGLIHRDIKPANILLENGVERVKITDFGLARLVDDVAITRTGEVSGTPQYMSPEQATGERIDHRSDLFSLGCVMYAMCTGHSPFRGDSLAHVIKRVTHDEPRPIEEQNPDVPRWLCDIIARLLDKSPEARFQSATELEQVLQARLSQRQASVLASGGRQPAEFTRPHPRRNSTPRPAPSAAGALLRQTGRTVTLISAAILLLPWLPIVYGWLVRDGDPMEFGGDLLRIVLPFAVLGLIVGGGMWLVGRLMLAGIQNAPGERGASAPCPPDHQSPPRVPWWSPLAVIAAAWLAVAAVDLFITQVQGGTPTPAGAFRLAALRSLFLSPFGVLLCGALVVTWLLARCRAGDDRPWRERMHAALGQPGKILTWLGVLLLTLVLIVPCVIGIGLGVPWYLSQESTVTLSGRYDRLVPIREIRTESGEKHVIDALPFRLKLPARRTELTVEYLHQGRPFEFLKVLDLREAGGTTVEHDFTMDIGKDMHERRNRQAQESHDHEDTSGEAVPPQASRAASVAGGAESDPFGFLPAPSRALDETSASPSSVVAAAPLPEGVTWTVYDKATMQADAQGRIGIAVRILSEGMLVALRRKSLFDGKIAAEEKVVTKVGFTPLRLELGEYEVLVRDEYFGWGDGRRGSIVVHESTGGALVVERDLAAVVRLAASPRRSRYEFRWNGVVYTLNADQARVVAKLAAAAVRGKPSVPEAELVQSPTFLGDYMSGRQSSDVRETFAVDGEPSPAWEKLVVPGESEETYRLAPIEQATIAFTLPEDVESVTITYPRGAGGMEFHDHEPRERRELTVRPGEYEVAFVPKSPDVGWMQPVSVTPSRSPRGLQRAGYQSLPVRRSIPVVQDAVVELDFQQSLADLVEPQPWDRATPDVGDWRYFLRWHGYSNVADKAYPDNAYSLDAWQAACVGRLLRGLVDGEPEVPEAELVELAAAIPPPQARSQRRDDAPPQNMESVFPGLADGKWKDLLQPGMTEGTWRLTTHAPTE